MYVILKYSAKGNLAQRKPLGICRLLKSKAKMKQAMLVLIHIIPANLRAC